MLINFTPILTYADEIAQSSGENIGMGGLCEHHTEHKEHCSYEEAVEGSLCTHEHNDLCGYVEIAEEVPCIHEHDNQCGYVKAAEGQECRYDCKECTQQTEPLSDTGTEVCTCEEFCDGTNLECTICVEDFSLCTRYIPTCYCAEKCTENKKNEFCDICSVDNTMCIGEDIATAIDTIISYNLWIGSVQVTSANLEIDSSDDSAGIYANSITIIRSNITAQGGKTTLSTYQRSSGIEAYEDIEISDGSIVNAKGGDSSEESFGISSDGEISINSSNIIATGGEGEDSFGIAAYDAIVIGSESGELDNSKIRAEGGNAENSYGFYSNDSNDIVIKGGDITVLGKKAAFNNVPDASNYKSAKIWYGNDESTNPSYSFTVTVNRTLIAVFEKITDPSDNNQSGGGPITPSNPNGGGSTAPNNSNEGASTTGNDQKEEGSLESNNQSSSTLPDAGNKEITKSQNREKDTLVYVIYIVQKGDTLWGIGNNYNCSVSDIVAANRDLIKNPNLIYKGWQLEIPQKKVTAEETNVFDTIQPEDEKTDVYIVKRGDTLWAIGKAYHCTFREIAALNSERIIDPNLIFEGWELKIPQD